MSQIKKAVIPVAGFGTRFLPATKAMPKEMLPIIDKPVIQYIVEEAVESGIEDIILVTGARKRAIEDHFDINIELENWCTDAGKTEQAKEIRRIAEMANFIYIRQKGPYGNGTPVLNAKELIGDEPFAYIFGDDPWVNPNKPRLRQLMDAYEKYHAPIMTAMEVTPKQTSQYGIIAGTNVEDDIIDVETIVEKPGPDKAPSHIAAVGAYILTPDIFDALEEAGLGKDNELWLTDGLEKIRETKKVYAKIVQGSYYDTGSKIGWLKANIDFALSRKDLSEDLKNYLKTII